MDYNKYGYGPNGEISPGRLQFSKIAHFMAMGNPNFNRETADKLYAQFNKNGMFDGTGGQTDKTDPSKKKDPGLIYNPNTGAFEPASTGKRADKEGVLSQVMGQQQQARSAMYTPIQVPQNTMAMASMNMPAAPMINPYNMQRYMDPRYRGGM